MPFYKWKIVVDDQVVTEAVQGVGSFIAPLLASRVFFASTFDDAQGLKNVQGAYLGVACCVGLLIVLFFLVPMLEVTNMDMQTQENEIAEEDVSPLHKQYNLILGGRSRFCYIVAVINHFINFCEEAGQSASTSLNLLAVGQGLHAFMRFVSGGLIILRPFKPRCIFAVYLFLCLVISLAAVLTTDKTSVALLILALCFEGISQRTLVPPSTPRVCLVQDQDSYSQQACFATIFTLALRRLSRHAKSGASFLVAAISGGAAFPPRTGAIATCYGSFHHAMAIPVAAYVASYVFPVYANIYKKNELDAHRAPDLNVTQEKRLGGMVGKSWSLEMGRAEQVELEERKV
ncbi:MAG: hypothetical protein Q9165_006967 [Trypethelium subeluteriae]